MISLLLDVFRFEGGKGVAHVLRKWSGRTCVVDLARAGVDGLEELVDLVVRHLLAEVREDVLELADADEARHVLVEDLEAAAVLLRLAGVAEAARAVQHPLEGLEVDCWIAYVSILDFFLVRVAGFGRREES